MFSPRPPQLGVPGPAAYYEGVHADRLRLLPDRPSSAFTAPKTRPLAEKLQQVGRLRG